LIDRYAELLPRGGNNKYQSARRNELQQLPDAHLGRRVDLLSFAGEIAPPTWRGRSKNWSLSAGA
jgi:hypothetical protein